MKFFIFSGRQCLHLVMVSIIIYSDITYVHSICKARSCMKHKTWSTMLSNHDTMNNHHKHSIRKISMSMSGKKASGQAKSSVFSSAALIAGTTIGGGFLALPYTTAPAGALPATVGLVGCWIYLLYCAFDLTTATFRAKQKIMESSNNTPSDVSMSSISIFTIARECFGNVGGVCTGILFVILTYATLIAQLSKAGSLISQTSIFSNLTIKFLSPASAATLLVATVMSILTFGVSVPFAESLNTSLTATMMASFGLILLSAPAAGWSFRGLLRHDFSQLVPHAGQPWAIPIFLQLLVYAETIPIICARLGDEQKVKKSIVIGSVVPLIMCILWTLTALGLTSLPMYGSNGILVDPIDQLLSQRKSTSILPTAVFALSLTAIATTVLGSILAISQFLEDILQSLPTINRHRGGLSTNTDTINSRPKLTTYFSRLVAIIPATMVSVLGSRSLYYYATAFAGAFPVTMLWGIFPSLACIKLSAIQKNSEKQASIVKHLVLVSLSVMLIATNVIIR